MLDHWLQASVDRAGGKPDENGHYAEMHIRGLETADEAKEYIRALHRSKRHMGYGMFTQTKRENGKYRIIFKVVTKTAARKYMLDRYGEDRSKWPYDPRRKNNG